MAFEYGLNRLWIDRVDGLSQAEIWLELNITDIEAADSYLESCGVARRDEIEPLPKGFAGFWIRGRIKQRIDALADNPYPSGIKKIEGEDELYRLGVGDYRILYQIKGKTLLVLFVRLRHRRDVYRRIGG